MAVSARILPVIIIAQFFCTSLWFASNGVMPDLIEAFDMPLSSLGHLTSSVQAGFIAGTLVFAILSLADRFPPSLVFMTSALLGGFFNLLMTMDSNTLTSLILLRFLTGFFLAGIYPVGMKIAADYFDRGLGRSLGWLVGALVLGTALPHLFSAGQLDLEWQTVILATSLLAGSGGLMLFVFVPSGPFRKVQSVFRISGFMDVFRDKELRTAALGYFGHMWELYAFWAFVPLMLLSYQEAHPESGINISLLSFIIIAIGAIGCVLATSLSMRTGEKRMAILALGLSCLCSLLSPVFFSCQTSVFIAFLLVWGFSVIPDSPLFSTLVARNASPELKGTALTIVNCIGFAITVASIQILNWLYINWPGPGIFLILGIGPLLGLVALLKSRVISPGFTK